MKNIKDRWEFYGENAPYFAVAAFDKYKRENLTEELKGEFFQSGKNHFDNFWADVENNLQKDFRPQRALAFGCGVGHLAIPPAVRRREVVGIDISNKMLDEAKINCQKRNINNAGFYQTDEFFEKDHGFYCAVIFFRKAEEIIY